MSSLSEILRLAGVRLDEIFAENPRVNDKIEDALAAFPKPMQTKILYGMEALRDLGPQGGQVGTWMAMYQNHMMQHVEPNPNDPTDMGRQYPSKEEATEVLKIVAKQFPFCIKRVSPGVYAWVEEATPDMSQDPEGMDGQTKNAIDQQVGLTYTALEAMRQMKTFTASDLAMWFNKRGFDPRQAQGLADHMLNQFRGMLSVNGDLYTIEEEKPHTDSDSMDMLKSFASNPRNPDA